MIFVVGNNIHVHLLRYILGHGPDFTIQYLLKTIFYSIQYMLNLSYSSIIYLKDRVESFKLIKTSPF